MVSVASVSQIYYSTVDIQHKTKAAVRAHIIFRRGAEFGSDLYTSKEPAGPKRVQLDLQTQSPSDTDQQPYHRGMLGSTRKRWRVPTAPPPIPLNGGAWGWWWGDLKQNGHGPHMKFRGPMHEHIYTSTWHVHAMASVASVSQIYYSTVDIQHKTNAAARVHIIFRRGAPTAPNLSTIDQPECELPKN